MTTKISKFLLIGFVATLLLAGAGFLGYQYLTTTPEYSLKEAGVAFKEQNWDRFSTYVDVKSVLDKASSDVIEEYIVSQGLDEGQAKMARSAVRLFKTQILGLMEQQFKATFFDLEKDEKESSAVSKKDTEEQSKTKKSISKLKLKDMKTEYQKEGIALVTVLLENEKKEKRIIKVQMVERKNYWQAVEITNFGEILKWSEFADWLKI